VWGGGGFGPVATRPAAGWVLSVDFPRRVGCGGAGVFFFFFFWKQVY